MEEKEKYLTRHELMQMSDMTKNTLVWYEKKGLLKPKFIGDNGYHYYSLDQYFELDLIKSMKWADVSLEECRKYSDDKTPEKYLEILLEQQSILDEKMKKIIYQKSIIDQTIQDFSLKRSFYTQDIVLVKQPDLYLLEEPIEMNTPKGKIYAFQRLFRNFRMAHRLYGTAPSMLHGVILLKEDIMEEKCNSPRKVCLKINGNVPVEQCKVIPRGERVIAYHKGECTSIEDTYSKVVDFVKHEHLKMHEDILEFEYINYLNEKIPDNYVKQIIVPVTRI